MLPGLYLVIPCYNEADVLKITGKQFCDKIQELISNNIVSAESGIVFIDDGSTDNTNSILINLCKGNNNSLITLSRNFGHQNALVAGLIEARGKCDIVITMDCDGQDDIDAVDLMIEEYKNGSDIVYGVRDDRKTDTVFKRFTASAFYRFMKLMGADTISNHADYRLLSASVLNALCEYDEVNLFLRGIIPLLGFRSTVIYYTRKERIAGNTHYSLSKMFSFALDGITGFSVKPLRIILLAGFIISVIAVILAIYTLVSYLSGRVVPGWSSMMLTICVLGGMQMISIGVLGEYIGKIFIEVKHRPRYIVKSKYNNGKEEK